MRYLLLAALILAAPLPAQSAAPSTRIEAGFKTLSTGSWEDAFKEWRKDGLPLDASEIEVRKHLEEWIPRTWNIGSWELVLSSPPSPSWQRQWWLATFDQGVVFFAFDHVWHKGEWRLFRIEVSRDPKNLIPNLDLLAGQAQRAR
jgi:hypothetical protein